MKELSMWKQICVTLSLVAAAGLASGQEPRLDNPGNQGRDPQSASPDANRSNAADRDTAPGRATGQSAAPGQSTAAGEAQGLGQERDLEAMLANCFVLMNQEEIALSRWAMERAQNPQTKQFAQMMIDEHTQFLSKLQEFATIPTTGTLEATSTAPGGNQPGTPSAASQRPSGQGQLAQPGQPAKPLAPNAPAQNPNAQAQSPPQGGQAPATHTTLRPGTLGVAAGQLGSVMLQIEQRAAAECLQLAQQDLSKHAQTGDFDQAFVGLQIAMHNGMLAKFRAAEPHVSPRFQAIIQHGTQTAMQHKQHAEELMRQLDVGEGAPRPAADDRATDPARRPASSIESPQPRTR
jgi:predicted outer membrane protein